MDDYELLYEDAESRKRRLRKKSLKAYRKLQRKQNKSYAEQVYAMLEVSKKNHPGITRAYNKYIKYGTKSGNIAANAGNAQMVDLDYDKELKKIEDEENERMGKKYGLYKTPSNAPKSKKKATVNENYLSDMSPRLLVPKEEDNMGSKKEQKPIEEGLYMNEYELLQLLEECGYEPSDENLEILKEDDNLLEDLLLETNSKHRKGNRKLTRELLRNKGVSMRNEPKEGLLLSGLGRETGEEVGENESDSEKRYRHTANTHAMKDETERIGKEVARHKAKAKQHDEESFQIEGEAEEAGDHMPDKEWQQHFAKERKRADAAYEDSEAHEAAAEGKVEKAKRIAETRKKEQRDAQEANDSIINKRAWNRGQHAQAGHATSMTSHDDMDDIHATVDSARREEAAANKEKKKQRKEAHKAAYLKKHGDTEETRKKASEIYGEQVVLYVPENINLDEDLSEYQLMQILDENGCTTSDEDVALLIEALESGAVVLSEEGPVEGKHAHDESDKVANKKNVSDSDKPLFPSQQDHPSRLKKVINRIGLNAKEKAHKRFLEKSN